jgi:hypothetical protein
MKKSILFAASLLALNLSPAFGQAPGTLSISTTTIPQAQPPALTKFNLDFPGGTPADLVKAIELRIPKPLNVIIPMEDANLQLPPLKMNDVTTPQLFAALEAASRKTVSVQTGTFGNPYSQFVTGYGFKTYDSPIADTSIWYFHAEKPSLPPEVSPAKICQFYSLDPYLNRGFTVDDITTAIQTGWEMAGLRTGAPKLNYHKETKLLIAYGEPDKLRTINQVLETLPQSSVPIATANEYKSEIRSMQSKIDELNMKLKAVSPPVAGGAPAEKSGK